MMQFSYFCGQIPYISQMPIFKVTQKQNWMASLEKKYKTGRENGMVCYISTKSPMDMKDQKSIIIKKSADSAK